MINRDILKKIRDQEMDRKAFLKYSGLVILGLTGFKTIISLLSQTESQKTIGASESKTGRGFSGGKYGA